MNKSELIAAAAERTGMPKTKVAEVFDVILGKIEQAVSEGDRVAIVGFGTFERLEVKARVGRNPQTGAPVKIEGGMRPKFSAGSHFKQVVAGAGELR